MFVERPQDPAAPVIDKDIDALQPPEHSVPPIAPLEGQSQLADRRSVLLGNEIEAERLIVQHCPDPGTEALPIQLQSFGLFGKSRVEIDDRFEIRRGGASDMHFIIIGTATARPPSEPTAARSLAAGILP